MNQRDSIGLPLIKFIFAYYHNFEIRIAGRLKLISTNSYFEFWKKHAKAIFCSRNRKQSW